MGGLFEDIGRTNTLGNASQTFLENAMRLRQQGNAEREAEATALRQGEMLRIQQEQEKRAERVSALAEEKVRRENEAAKAKADKMSRVRTEADILAEADARGQGQFMRHIIATAKSFGGGKAIPRPDGMGEDIYFSGQDIADALEEQKNMSDPKIVEQGVWFAKEDAKTRFENAKKALEKKPDDPNVQKAFADAKAASLAADKDWYDFGRKSQTSSTGGAGQGAKKPTHMMPDGTLLYPSGNGLARKITDEAGNVTLDAVSSEEEKLARMLPSSMSSDKASLESIVGEEHPDWPYYKVREEAAKRSQSQTVSVKPTTDAYSGGEAVGTNVITQTRSGKLGSTVVQYPKEITQEGKKVPVSPGGKVGEASAGEQAIADAFVRVGANIKDLDSIKAGLAGATGPADARWVAFANKIGVAPNELEARINANLYDLVAADLKADSGLTVNDREAIRKANVIPQPTDTLPVLLAKMDRYKKVMGDRAVAYDKQWRSNPMGKQVLRDAMPWAFPTATFKTVAEANAAAKSGKIKSGDRIIVGGKSGVWE